MRVLVTGTTGFAGAAVTHAIAAAGHEVIAVVRPGRSAPASATSIVELPDLAAPFDADRLVRGAEAIVHLAGIAHASNLIPDATYAAVNARAAGTLAAAGAAHGIRCFVNVSSVRAQTGAAADGIVTEARAAVPSDAYGRSKLQGEFAVARTLASTKTAYVILRPVLMYGAQAKANMAALMRLARSPWPLPLGGLTARRSILAVENFASAVVHALSCSQTHGGTFLVADREALTIGEMLAAMRTGLSRPPGIVNVPPLMSETLLRAAGKKDLADRLFGDLVVSTEAFQATGWVPPRDARAALAAIVRASPEPRRSK